MPVESTPLMKAAPARGSSPAGSPTERTMRAAWYIEDATLGFAPRDIVEASDELPSSGANPRAAEAIVHVGAGALHGGWKNLTGGMAAVDPSGALALEPASAAVLLFGTGPGGLDVARGTGRRARCSLRHLCELTCDFHGTEIISHFAGAVGPSPRVDAQHTISEELRDCEVTAET